MNIVNFTDGVDGLAAGVCTIAAATLAVIALSLDKAAGQLATCTGAGVLAAITAGAAFGFLYHNFHPASIFMGDAGSNLLGLLLACVAIQGTLKTAAIVALFFPLAVLAVPIIDGAFVMMKRLKYRRPVYSGRPLASAPPVERTSASRSGEPCSTCTAGRSRSPASPGAALRAVLGRPRPLQPGLDGLC